MNVTRPYKNPQILKNVLIAVTLYPQQALLTLHSAHATS